MSSNIYEDPNVKYSKGVCGDGEDAVETLVDIYESVETLRDHHVGPPTQDKGPHNEGHLPVVQKNPFRVAALTLGLLCLLLVAAVVILSVLNFSAPFEKQPLGSENQKLQSHHDSPSCQLENQAQGNFTGWRRFKCQCYYKSNELKTWEDSRKDCQSSGADLVIINNKEEHEFVKTLNGQGDSWIGLQSLKTDERWAAPSWEWKWVDSSKATYLAFQVHVNVKPEDAPESTVYIDGSGTWTHAKNGTKGWICERVSW